MLQNPNARETGSAPHASTESDRHLCAGGCPVIGGGGGSGGGGCPVIGGSGGGGGGGGGSALNPDNQMPYSANAPQTGQAAALPTGRQASSIPIGVCVHSYSSNLKLCLELFGEALFPTAATDVTWIRLA